MLTRRLIPCLDVRDGRTVKGVNFVGLRDAGDPVELAALYSDAGADELVLLDISASREGRKTFLDMVERVARAVSIPFTVGGGIASAKDVKRVLSAGADKVSLNSALVERPELLAECVSEVGSQSVVAAVDARREGEHWKVWIKGGSERTEHGVVEWIRHVQEQGAGEILLTSMDRDGTRRGYDLPLHAAVQPHIRVPLIASGGAGSALHMAEVLYNGLADAVLLAGILHDGVATIQGLKQELQRLGVRVRL